MKVKDVMQPRHTGSERFHEIVSSLSALHDKKQADYGSDTDPFANLRASAEMGITPAIGVVLRMNDKMTRIKQFTRRGSLENESVEDSLRDIAVYAVIALVLLEEGKKK
jgi:hypothetical protein